MKNKFSCSVRQISRLFCLTSIVALTACAGTGNGNYISTPSVDYVEGLDVYSAPHRDSFLNQLAMNYRSYAIYNARTSGYPDVGEQFAQKAIVAFSGETPLPENVGDWQIRDDQTAYILRSAYNDMITEFKNDATEENPEVAAEIQAKFDCWLSAVATGQVETAKQCQERFEIALDALRNCDKGVGHCGFTQQKQLPQMNTVVDPCEKGQCGRTATKSYYPDTRSLRSFGGETHARDGIIIINNVNIPDTLVQTVPVTEQKTPFVFNQNIYGTSKDNKVSAVDNSDCDCAESDEDCCCDEEANDEQINEIKIVTDGLISRDEFANLMMAMRRELQKINGRLDGVDGDIYDVNNRLNGLNSTNQENGSFEELKDQLDEMNSKLDGLRADFALVKIQQIPIESQASCAEEVMYVPFDFEKQQVPVDYDGFVDKLVEAVQNSKNIQLVVLDTSKEKEYKNYELDKQQVREVENVFIERGVPAEQIGNEIVLTSANNTCTADISADMDRFYGLVAEMREEMRAITERLDGMENSGKDEKTVIKVQQIPLEPQQHVMEEVFEVLFDFDKSSIKPEYQDLIKQLAEATQENKNVKVSVVGHTDTVGTSGYNYALGGRRAEAVRKMLIDNGIPASQIVAVSAGKEDLKVPTANGVKNAENRRVRVVKETHYSEPAQTRPVADIEFETIEQ